MLLSSAYRERLLCSLLPIWPGDLAIALADTISARRAIVGRLKRQMTHCRRQGLERHWDYSVPRHHSLIAMWAIEKAALLTMIASERARRQIASQSLQLAA